MDDTARGFAYRKDKAPYQTFFHEYGHYIDHRNGQAMQYASEAAGLGATAKKEVQAMLRTIKKTMGYGSVNEAKEHLTREIIALYRSTPELIGGLSDIIHGGQAERAATTHFPPTESPTGREGGERSRLPQRPSPTSSSAPWRTRRHLRR